VIRSAVRGAVEARSAGATAARAIVDRCRWRVADAFRGPPGDLGAAGSITTGQLLDAIRAYYFDEDPDGPGSWLLGDLDR
jgi:hypothetical protein